MTDAPVAAPAEEFSQLSPGVTIKARDEYWLVTHVSRSSDGFKVKARGLSDYVRDTTSTFYTALDRDLEVFDPAQVTITPDNSPGFRTSRLWLESTIRQTPVPLYQDRLEVAERILADKLDYQVSAVRRAVSPELIRPRILLADAVGLGKTLEIGMIMAELIRRGRGERILVITPKHVLEQFQQEIWTRCAVPLVRLDSLGIQRVRQKLPASKNPFTYFPRVIVSMDTLKSAKYKAQLEKVHWDIVVIDEIHNATNSGTQNNALARTVARQTEALILASATPHNGKPDSFKEILKLLDPLAVRPDGSIDLQVAKRMIIRRHRNSPEVKQKVGEKWAQRPEPTNLLVDASKTENAVANELRDTWLTPASRSTGRTTGRHLFAWTLVKAFLSSPAALDETIANRLRTLKTTGATAAHPNEREDLTRLRELNAAVTARTSNKYATLLNYLTTTVGIAKKSPNRVVVFSERVATLSWLRENLIRDLGLKPDAVKTMHGQMSDIEQMQLIDEFKRADTPLRVLITGDVASEGVNLHAQCHDLVHYDIPWSLIRIQQRNGRIDRYGQQKPPRIAALLLDPADADAVGEIRVLSKLMEREYEANQLLGDVASLMGEHSEQREEDGIRDVLRGAKDFDATVRTAGDVLDAAANPSTGGDGDGSDIEAVLAQLLALDPSTADGPTATDGLTATQEPAAPATPPVSSLYRKEKDYLVDALAEAFNGVPSQPPAAGGVGLTMDAPDLLELTPPPDLQRRFDYLPQDYVSYRQIKQRLMLATTATRGEAQLAAAREKKSEKSWPKAHYLGPLHPVTSWAADRALSSLERSQIPAFVGTVEKMSALFMTTLTNSRGQVVSRAFHVATPGPPGMGIAHTRTIEDVFTWLHGTGLTKDAISTGTLTVPAEAEELLRDGLQAAQGLADLTNASAQAQATARAAARRELTEEWEAQAAGRPGSRPLMRSRQVIAEERGLLAATIPERTLVRPLAVIIPTTTAAHK
ncbi:DEAD/DEAH box helicase [Corynebacterium uterequi]|nr:DEAD/DEAH box helicase [Corynebacterium uterequi]